MYKFSKISVLVKKLIGRNMVKVEERLVISMKIGDQPAVIKIIFNMHGIRKVSFYLTQPFKYC